MARLEGKTAVGVGGVDQAIIASAKHAISSSFDVKCDALPSCRQRLSVHQASALPLHGVAYQLLLASAALRHACRTRHRQ